MSGRSAVGPHERVALADLDSTPPGGSRTILAPELFEVSTLGAHAQPNGDTVHTTSTVAEVLDLGATYVTTNGRDPVHRDDRPSITSPEAAASELLDIFEDLDREACVMLVLDTRHRLLGVELVSVGSVDHTFMAPREVFRTALLRGAAAIVLAHNHPSGDCAPSPDDAQVTKRLGEAAQIIGVDLLDHLVIGHGGSWSSLARAGVLA